MIDSPHVYVGFGARSKHHGSDTRSRSSIRPELNVLVKNSTAFWAQSEVNFSMLELGASLMSPIINKKSGFSRFRGKPPRI